MEKVPTVPNLAFKALEIVFALYKFYIHDQKELKLTKNTDCNTFTQKAEITHCHF